MPNVTVRIVGSAGAWGGLRAEMSGNIKAPPLVGTITVKEAGVPVFSVTLVGALQVAPRGAPVQVKETVPL